MSSIATTNAVTKPRIDILNRVKYCVICSSIVLKFQMEYKFRKNITSNEFVVVLILPQTKN